jgi:alanine or glycine:cation symporter, AGCS family
VHAGRQVPQRVHRRHRFRRADVLPFEGLAERSEKLRTLGKVLAVMFAVFCIGGSFGGGNMFQANQSFKQVVSVTGGDASWLADKGWLFGIVIAALVGLVIIGGIQSIARVTSKVVPLMAMIYVTAGLTIIGFT